jgi:hypothetical protein
MGTWSVTLYGSDAASDLRDQVRELLRTPLEVSAIIKTLSTGFPGLQNKDDEEYSDLWLALADQFHRHAVPARDVLATAASIIDDGLDLRMKQTLGMSDPDLAKRRRMLDELRRKWATPHPKPVARKVQAQPDAFIFEPGDCVCYPVKETGRTINPYFARPEADPDWRHDGYGAMAVLTRGHYLGTFAWYGFARLGLLTPDKPALDRCAAAMVDSQTTTLAQRMGEKPELCIYASRLTPAWGRKMRFEILGRFVLNEAVIREDLAAFLGPRFVPGPCLAGELSGFGLREPSTIPLARYVTPNS